MDNKNKNTQLITVFLIIILGVSVVVGVVYFMRSGRQQEVSQQTGNVVVATNTQKPADVNKPVSATQPNHVSVVKTDNIYRNDKLGFEIGLKDLKVHYEFDGGVMFYEGDITVHEEKNPNLDSLKNESKDIVWGSDFIVSGERAISGHTNEGGGADVTYVVHNGKLFIFLDGLSDPKILSTFKFLK